MAKNRSFVDMGRNLAATSLTYEKFLEAAAKVRPDDLFDMKLLRDMAPPYRPFEEWEQYNPRQDSYTGLGRWVAEHITLGPYRTVDLTETSDGFSLHLKMRVYDRDRHNKLTTIQGGESYRWTGEEPRQQVIRCIREQMHKFAQHEEDEWLRVDGQLVYDPHGPPVSPTLP